MVPAHQVIQAREIDAHTAARYLSEYDLVDPDGLATVDSVCKAGQAYEMDLSRSFNGKLVYVLEVCGPIAWITAAAGTTRGAAASVLWFIERQARALGASILQFQTVRRGLMRLAERRGYERRGSLLAVAL